MHKRLWADALVSGATLLGATVWGRAPRRGALRDGAGAGGWQHEDWNALVRRFVHDGAVDYATFRRVRRILRAYLQRIADARPDSWPDADEQLAFYLNAYNAWVVYQVIEYAPTTSVQQIAGFWTRPFAVGGRNLSLHTLAQAVVRAYGDPRAVLALSSGTRGGPVLQPWAYTGRDLQAQLDTVTRQFLADEERGLRYDGVFHVTHMGSVLQRYAGDWVAPERMPGPWALLRGVVQPSTALPALSPWLPPTISEMLGRLPPPRVVGLPFDWALNS